MSIKFPNMQKLKIYSYINQKFNKMSQENQEMFNYNKNNVARCVGWR